MAVLSDSDLDFFVMLAQRQVALTKKLEAAVEAGDREAAWAVAVEMCADQGAAHHATPVVPIRKKPARKVGDPEAA